MKSITKNLFFSILCFLSSLAIAGQNDYDGKWHVDFTCSINTKNQRPGFSYSEAWDIKGNRIQHTYKTTTKFGTEQTVWNGQISNQNISSGTSIINVNAPNGAVIGSPIVFKFGNIKEQRIIIGF